MVINYTIDQLVAAFIGGGCVLLGVIFTNRANTKRQETQFKNQLQQKQNDQLLCRGEELYELTDKWMKALIMFSLRRASVMKGSLSYDECHELDIKDDSSRSYNFGRISMLIDIYFPSTKSAYDKIIEARTEMNKIEIAFKHSYKTGAVAGSQFLQNYIEKQKALEEAGDYFHSLLIACIRNI